MEMTENNYSVYNFNLLLCTTTGRFDISNLEFVTDGFEINS